MIEVRDEKAGDSAAIWQVHERAFPTDLESRLVELLREAGKARVSLVAVDDGQVVGHILFSDVSISKAPEGFRAAGLAPVAVLPESQSQGIGGRLIREGLERCKQAGYDAIVLLGYPAYYSRFGFVRAIDYQLDNEYGVVEEFMVLELRKGALASVSGMVKYQPEFQTVVS
jgi:putative acetyltransferase